MNTKNIVLLTAILFLLSLTVAQLTAQNFGGNNEQTFQAFYTKYKNRQQMNLNMPGAIAKGSNAPVMTIVEFIDFLCPHCKYAGSKISNFARRYNKNVKMVYMMYPLDASCNSAIKNPEMHKGACLMAYGAVCADKLGKFEQYHDNIFYRQDGYRGKFNQKDLDVIVSILGVNAGQFNQCVGSPATKAIITNSISLGNRSGVQGTPTVFVNGRLASEPIPDEFILNRLLQEFMRK